MFGNDLDFLATMFVYESVFTLGSTNERVDPVANAQSYELVELLLCTDEDGYGYPFSSK